MGKVTAIALAAGISLSGCSAITPSVVGDASACASALFSMGTIDPAAMALAALSSPACQGLATDVIQGIVTQTQQKQLARGLRK